MLKIKLRPNEGSTVELEVQCSFWWDCCWKESWQLQSWDKETDCSLHNVGRANNKYGEYAMWHYKSPTFVVPSFHCKASRDIGMYFFNQTLEKKRKNRHKMKPLRFSLYSWNNPLTHWWLACGFLTFMKQKCCNLIAIK